MSLHHQLHCRQFHTNFRPNFFENYPTINQFIAPCWGETHIWMAWTFQMSVGVRYGACYYMLHPANDDITFGYLSGNSSEQHWFPKIESDQLFPNDHNFTFFNTTKWHHQRGFWISFIKNIYRIYSSQIYFIFLYPIDHIERLSCFIWGPSLSCCLYLGCNIHVFH